MNLSGRRFVKLGEKLLSRKMIGILTFRGPSITGGPFYLVLQRATRGRLQPITSPKFASDDRPLFADSGRSFNSMAIGG